MHDGQHAAMHMLLSSSAGMQCAGLVQGPEGGLLPRVLAVAVASSVISQVTGPHSALISPKVIEFRLGLSATSSEATNVYWEFHLCQNWSLCRELCTETASAVFIICLFAVLSAQALVWTCCARQYQSCSHWQTS